MKKFFLILIFSSYFQMSVQASGQSAVVSAHPLATKAGIEILQQGGNAFDAAVAVSGVLAVVEPASSGLGGGGFWLLHRTKDNHQTMIDGREKAPLAAHQNMYLDQQGKYLPGLSKDGPLSAGIPGLPAAIVHIAKKYGRIPLAELLQPAITYAEAGFTTSDRFKRMLSFRLPLIQQASSTSAVLLTQNKIPKDGHKLVQSDLAKTLKSIAKNGHSGFYNGEVAKKLVQGVRQAGGIWTVEDLANYNIIERKPISGRYKDIRITTAAPPSSGGIVLVQALNMLSALPLNEYDEITRKHLIIEAMRRAYHDRALYLGDPDFVSIPTKRLLSQDYALGLISTIRLDKTLPSEHLSGDFKPATKGNDTTHFSILDKEGNRVSATLSINYPFGSGFIPPGTGVILNNEMDDFVSQVGSANGYGLMGGRANTIESGKRMLSSMTPTFLEDGHRLAILGTPGGSRIISMVLLAVLDFAQGHLPESWVSLPRFHHQYLPDRVQYEPAALTPHEINALKTLGYQLKPTSRNYGNMQAISLNKVTGKVFAASDPRGEGLAVVQ